MSKPPFIAERSKIERSTNDSLVDDPDLPPVVARMVVEIRSDGSRTMARGALEDLQSGERVALQADAATPLALAAQLTKALTQIPTLARDLTSSAAREFSQAQLEKIKKTLGPLSELSPFNKKGKKKSQDG